MTRLSLLLAAAMLGGCAAATAVETVETTGSGTMAAAEIPPAQADSGPEFGTFGFDVEGMDRSVAPGENFYRFANGTWLETTEIPADKSNYGMFTRLAELSQERTRGILEEAQMEPDSRIGAAYASFLDLETVEQRGLAAFQPWMERVEAIETREDYARVLGEASRFGIDTLYGTYVDQDDRNPDAYALKLAQGGLGMPDRDYYLAKEGELAETKAAYEAYLAEMLRLAGEENAAARAAAVVDLEERIAEVHWTQVESRDSEKTYNPMTIAEFQAMTPGLDMVRYLTAEGYDVGRLIALQPSAIEGIAKITADTPLPVLKDQLLLRSLSRYADYLPQTFVETDFDFYGRTLSGTPEIAPRWERAVDFTSTILGEEVGKHYVARYFPPETKAAADRLVRNVIAAMDRRLASLEWMAPETKAKARAKLAAFTPKIGYPEEWRDYSALEIRADDLIGNAMRAAEFETQRNIDKLGGPVDRGEWFLTPMTVNAYANFTMNEIVFPAAILQPPFFDPDADDAINYGGIGAVIGHEISHHFDDQGRRYNAAGELSEWWTPADVERFKALAAELVEQYDDYEALPGEFVQGALTLGENIADLAGLTIAYDAYRASLNGEEPPVLNGFTGDQRFYLGWAQVWRRKYREENLRQRLLTDPHAPAEYRTFVVRNLDPWYGAFDPATTAPLYLAPEERVRIW